MSLTPNAFEMQMQQQRYERARGQAQGTNRDATSLTLRSAL